MERTLTRLLYRRDARAEPRAGDFAALDPAALEQAAALVRQALFARRYRGTGGLVDWYPRTIAAWRAAHPDDAALDRLAAAFLESPAAEAWREGPAAEPGMCLEEAFYRFAEAAGIGEPTTREDEWLAAQLRALALCPEPAFLVPPELRAAPGGGFFALAERGDAPVLHAAVRGRCIRGVVTPGLAAMLRGAAPVPPAGDPVRVRLEELGLL